MRSTILCIMSLTFLVATEIGAVDLSKGFLLDIPDEIAARQFGRAPVSTMTPDGEGSVDISDLSAMIDYLYISFTPVKDCL